MMVALKRRAVITAIGAGLVGAAALAVRPRNKGAPHSEYFARASKALRAAGIATPALIIDRERLLANANKVVSNVAGRLPVRLVAKSLPCLPLIDQLMQAMQTRRLMVFNLPYLQELAAQRGDVDLLLGKPLPVAVAAEFYRSLKGGQFQPGRQLQWLVDTPQRLAQYRDLARGQQLDMRVSLEIDVGLHRGGIDSPQVMQQMLDILKSEPRLQWAGMMGYDAHVSKLPLASLREKALVDAKAIYHDYAAQATQALRPGGGAEGLVFNAGGSPTYLLHDGSGTANEVALGSALVKPSDFDTEGLKDLAPAAYIATPVLKAGRHFQMPRGVEALGDAVRAWDVNQEQVYFIYGGNWMADAVSPVGLAPSGLYGNSSNQQALLGSGAQQLLVDDFVFFRPRQSESVLQQFGDIVVMEGGNVTERWPVMPPMP
ncbi:alanine racemase [Pseudoduganella violaceinigra]|uniref:alanine racemase n=1 Tax=Pseudoduganella violaceinigra TaxID=246602 RepID=UPI001E570A21|nr:alanine racemase [Pseudoduganella violaceinigra]